MEQKNGCDCCEKRRNIQKNRTDGYAGLIDSDAVKYIINAMTNQSQQGRRNQLLLVHPESLNAKLRHDKHE